MSAAGEASKCMRKLKAIWFPVLCVLLAVLTACGAPAGEPVQDRPLTCTVSISCASLLDNMERLDENKKALVPENGVVLPETQAAFAEDESVYDVLQRVCQENKLHMEAEFTPVYDSYYIQGIGNLYEFDAGSLSGWMYAVNGWFPNYGCSQYELKDGDAVTWVYTCDLGADVGGDMAAAGE